MTWSQGRPPGWTGGRRNQPQGRGPWGRLITSLGGITLFSGSSPIHLLSDGQSLSVGTSGAPPLTTTNPYGAPIPLDDAAFGTLVESGVESHVSASAFQLRDNFTAQQIIAGSVGSSGATIADLQTTPHTTTVEARMNSVNGNDNGTRLGAVLWIQGYSDAASAENYYRGQLASLQTYYDTQAKARYGGQAGADVQIWCMQLGAGTEGLTAQDFSRVPYEMWEARRANPNAVQVAGPMYAFTNTVVDHYGAAGSGDGVHMENLGYRLMGELLGYVIYTTYVLGVTYVPLHITSAVVSGSNIVLTFSEDVDVDTTAVAAAPASGDSLHGIYLEDAGPAPEVIRSISKTASNQLTAVCSGPPHQGARIWTGRESRRGAFGGSGNAAPNWGSMRTNVRATNRTFIGTESGLDHYKWLVHQDEAVSGGAAVNATAGTVTLDRRWTVAYGGVSGVPAASTAWSPLVAGRNPTTNPVSLPYQGGMSVLGQATTGLADAAIGATLVDQGFNNALGMNFRLTDTTDLADSFDKPDGHRWLFRFVGNIQRPMANSYLFHQGAFSGNRIIVLATSAGNISVTAVSASGTRTHAAAAILPATSTLGMIDICIEHDFQQRLQIHICANGSVVTSTASAFTFGAITGLQVAALAASNGSAGWLSSLVSFYAVAIGEDASWWNPEAYGIDNGLL